MFNKIVDKDVSVIIENVETVPRWKTDTALKKPKIRKARTV